MACANLYFVSPKHGRSVNIAGGIDTPTVYPSETFSVAMSGGGGGTFRGTVSKTDGITSIHLDRATFTGEDTTIGSVSALTANSALIPGGTKYNYICVLSSSPTIARTAILRYLSNGYIQILKVFTGGNNYVIPEQTVNFW